MGSMQILQTKPTKVNPGGKSFFAITKQTGRFFYNWPPWNVSYMCSILFHVLFKFQNQQYIVALNDGTPTLKHFTSSERSSIKKLYRQKSGHLDSPILQKLSLIRVILFLGGKNDTMTLVLVCFHFHL